MGRQIRFFMDIEDEQAFMDFVRSESEVALVAGTFVGPELEVFNYPRELRGRALGESCHLWNRTISPPPEVKRYQQQGYFAVDFMQSEVISFWQSKRIAESLSMGRLHIETTVLLPNGSVGPKREVFIKWYELLARWIRKGYAKSQSFPAFVGPNAARLVQSGIQFTGHVL